MMYNSNKTIPGTNGEMTEHDLFLLLEKLEAKNKERYNIKDTGENIEYDLKHSSTLPQTEKGIKTLAMIGVGTVEELIEENKKLYETRAWEKYI